MLKIILMDKPSSLLWRRFKDEGIKIFATFGPRLWSSSRGECPEVNLIKLFFTVAENKLDRFSQASLLDCLIFAGTAGA